MATIRPNDNAPAEEAKYILPTATFDLAPGGSYETNDRQVISDAEAHPWLTVEHPEVEDVSVQRADKSVPYKDDYLAAVNSKAFDPEEVAKIEGAKVDAHESRTAIDAGLDQSKAVEVQDVAVTLAADDASDDDTDKPARKRSAAKKED